MRDGEGVAADVRDGGRRAHARQIGVAELRLVHTARFARRDELDDAGADDAVLDAEAKDVDRGARGDLAGAGAAHPVGHRVQRGAGQHGVLVRPALATGVGEGGLFDDAKHGGTQRAGGLSRGIEHGVADRDLVAAAQRPGPLEALTIHVRAVRRPEILQDRNPGLQLDARVARGGKGILERDLHVTATEGGAGGGRIRGRDAGPASA